MRSHILKIWPEHFQPVINGLKTFEIRKNDRNYKEGDIIVLKEYDPKKDTFTNRYINVRITYILKDVDIVPKDYCIMSIVPYIPL